MALTGNKGEWSEIYALLRLLSIGKLYAADADLNKMDSVFYEILKIIREENIGVLEFYFENTENVIKVTKQSNRDLLVALSTNYFEEEADYLLNKIKKAGGSTFSSERTEDFMKTIQCERLKAPARDKSDIIMELYDPRAGYTLQLGFSIKSRLGQPSTLLNPGKTTNFTYKLSGIMDDDIVDDFNKTSLARGSFKNALNRLYRSDVNFEFVSVDEPIFKNNLLLMDSDLPKISAWLLLEFYCNGKSTVSEAITSLIEKNSLEFDIGTGHRFYETKFKRLITASALGMLPASVWNDKADATGGYIIVREDGEVLCYHLYNRNEFEDYLLKNTCFDTPSRRRYGYGQIYKENNEYYLKLNMQIRFIR